MIGTAQAAGEGRGQPAGGGNNQGLQATAAATELTVLEGGSQTGTGACGAPHVRTHLRIAQASGTAELGTRAGASGTTSGLLKRRNGDPQRWPVRHHDRLEGGRDRPRKRSRTVPAAGDRNAELCTGCGKGGHLYCCDGCPQVWHAGWVLAWQGWGAPEVGRGVVRARLRSGKGQGGCAPDQWPEERYCRQGERCGNSGSGEPRGRKRDRGCTYRCSWAAYTRYMYTGKRSERSPYIAARAGTDYAQPY